jgi:hypothetical protein
MTSRLGRWARSMVESPGFTLMRGVARFNAPREVLASTLSLPRRLRLAAWEDLTRQGGADQLEPSPDLRQTVAELDAHGIALGLKLAPTDVSEIVQFARTHPCFADRQADRGFFIGDHGSAQNAIGKSILVAQYFNTETGCAAIGRLTRDRTLNLIAARFLRSVPRFVGANLWWTFPVDASEEDRHRHAHLFHRDVDDFRFIKFFFYLTDVEPGEGAHVCVRGSHRAPPRLQPLDRWKLRRYTDPEIAGAYPEADILEITGKAGTGFAENTLCVHKGMTPRSAPRLLLQLQFALFDYGVMHDRRDPGSLRMIDTR